MKETRNEMIGDGQSSSAGKLSVTNLCKSFQSPANQIIEVLRDVSFSVAAGETVAIMGASGAGKSTLLNLLGGLEVPDGGAIHFNELDVARQSRTLNCLSFIFQFHYLLADLTALENVALPLLMRRTSLRESKNKAREVLQAMGLGDQLQHQIGYLSGGEQQRVAVARALITSPTLVLADEPTGNLDASMAEDLGAVLVDYSRQHGAIVVLATHSESLARLCDRVLLLQKRRIVENNTRSVSHS